MNHPVLSIIVPVFNTYPYLDECLKSLSRQTLENIEIICVDNGSTDGSWEVLKSYERKHKNIILLKHPEGRQGAARNAGLKVAKGEYIGFVDSDDYITDNMFEQMYNTAIIKGAEIAICNIQLYFEKERTFKLNLPERWFANNHFSIDKNPVFLRNLTICNKIFKSDLIKGNNISFPEGMYHEDQVFVIKAFFLAKSIVAINTPLYVYRKQREGSVNTQSDNTTFSIFDIMLMVNKFLNDKGILNQHIDLFREIEITRYLMLFDLLQKKYKKEYFNRMCIALRDSELSPPLKLCTPSEYNNYLVIKNYPYWICIILFYLKKQFGKLISIPQVNKAYIGFKRKLNITING